MGGLLYETVHLPLVLIISVKPGAFSVPRVFLWCYIGVQGIVKIENKFFLLSL